jgi:hypothetical protein
VVNISNFTIRKILDKQSGPSGIKYKCELESLWLSADWVKRFRMGRIGIEGYEDRLIQVGRLGTLRTSTKRKRKLSQV